MQPLSAIYCNILTSPLMIASYAVASPSNTMACVDHLEHKIQSNITSHVSRLSSASLDTGLTKYARVRQTVNILVL